MAPVPVFFSCVLAVPGWKRPAVGDSRNRMVWMKLWYAGRLSMVYREIRYGMPSVYLCCTIGAPMLHLLCQGAALFLALLFVSLYRWLFLSESVGQEEKY